MPASSWARPAKDVYADPKHPYTAALLRSIPDIDLREIGCRRSGRRQALLLAAGCPFHPVVSTRPMSA
jgi:ABC-type dipeptide/oligopeptide/nickel transport system ATPase component